MNVKLALLISALAISPAALAVTQSGVLPDDWYLRFIPQQDSAPITSESGPLPETKIDRATPPEEGALSGQANTTGTRESATDTSRPLKDGRAGSKQDKQAMLEDWKRASPSINPIDDVSRGNESLLVKNKPSSASGTGLSARTSQKALPQPDKAALTAKSVQARQMRELEKLVVTAKEPITEVPAQRPVVPNTPGDAHDSGRHDAPSGSTSAASLASSDPAAPVDDTPARERAESQARSGPPQAVKRAAPPKTAKPSVVISSTQTAPSESANPAKLASANQVKPTAIPVPIQFVYREATFTPSGDAAAELLLEYVMAKRPASITLSGHADERASAAYNMDLSRRRLQSVAEFLRKAGYEGKVILVPLGESQPYSEVDRVKYSLEELYQLDRRVELHLGGFRYGKIPASGSDGT
ncbi:MAG: OmpA family protein [Hyphomicrobiaceae bacterium]